MIVARGWSEAQKRAYVLADNQLALNASWDTELLKIEISGLGEDGFDLGLLGFGEDFLADLLTERGGLTDPDEAPPLGVNVFHARAIYGSAEIIGCCAAMRPAARMWRGCLAA